MFSKDIYNTNKLKHDEQFFTDFGFKISEIGTPEILAR
jgi:hypothetical protein